MGAPMSIQLTDHHVAWLHARVADGTFATLNDALAQIVEERIALEDSDLDWARALVDEARADIAAGRVMSIEEHKARNNGRRQKSGV
jgi:antitoxin ParD1/3/4